MGQTGYLLLASALVFIGVAHEIWKSRRGRGSSSARAWGFLGAFIAVVVGCVVLLKMVELDKQAAAERRARAWANFMSQESSK